LHCAIYGNAVSRARRSREKLSSLDVLYDVSLGALVAVSIAAELAALVPFLMGTRLLKGG